MIPKKYIYISLLIFAFNFFVSISTLDHQATENGFWAFIIATIPLWGCIMVGSVLGFVIILFLPKNLKAEQRYIASKIYGVLLANILFMTYYVYRLIEWGMLKK